MTPIEKGAMSPPILTIAVPTYNRSELLSVCLSQLIPQVCSSSEEVELLVSDNCSTDDTKKVVEAYLATGVPLRFLQNDSNLGPDRNFAKCFAMASGKFVLMISDDDVLLDGGLEKLLAVLRQGNPGVVHLRSYSFQEDYRTEQPRRAPSGITSVYSNLHAFAKQVNVNLTFISGNVVNKSLVGSAIRSEDFFDTRLVQLSWMLSAAMNAETNVFIDEFIVAAKAENTGGYQLCNVFGVNMNRIFKMFEAQGADPEFFRIINRKALTTFFPGWILKLRSKGTEFHAENYFSTLRPVFHDFPAFWVMVWPAATWPVPLARMWFKLCREWLRIIRRW